MSWYIHPTKQLRDDELPPELVVTNRNGSIEQVYVPYNASDQLQAENAKLRDESDYVGMAAYELGRKSMADENSKLRKLIAEWYPHMKKRVGVDALWQWGHMTIMRELGVEVDG